jgi:hypothetical protein
MRAVTLRPAIMAFSILSRLAPESPMRFGLEHPWELEGGRCEEDAEGGIWADEEVLYHCWLSGYQATWWDWNVRVCRHRPGKD